MNNEEKIIDDLFEKSMIDHNKKHDGEGRKNVHVSDLVGDCMRQPWYRLNGFKPEPRTFQEVIGLVHGTALHECCDLGGIEHEIKLAGNLLNMRKSTYEIKQRPDSERFSIVQGSMDDLIVIDGEYIICDKKTTKKIPYVVPLRYQTQMNIYKLLYFIQTGIDVKRAAIIYIDKTTGWSRHKTISFELLDIDEIKPYCTDKLLTLASSKPPDRFESPICKFCPHKKVCDPGILKVLT